MRTNLTVTWASIAAGALLAGCAGMQKKDGQTDPGGEIAGEPAATGADPMAVLKQQPKKQEPAISADAREDFEKAWKLYQKLYKTGTLKGSDCDEAGNAFRRVADQNPNMLLARHNEASVYWACGKQPEASRIWDDLARKGYAPAIAQQGFNAYQRGDANGAETYLKRAIETDPQIGSVEARLNLAQIYRERAQNLTGAPREQLHAPAIQQLRTVLALDGNNLQAYATLCYIYFDRGLHDAATLIANSAIKKAEEIATGKFEDEVMAETVDRTRAAAQAAAAKRKGKKGKGAAAEEEKEEKAKAAKEIPIEGTGWTPQMRKQIAVVHNTLGLVALDKKHYSKAYSDAIASFRKAVELDPELNEARLNLAAVSLRFRDYNTAEENFRAVVKAQPRNYEANIGLGVALRGNRKIDEAEQQYLAAQKLDPQRADSYFNLGLLYQEYKGTDRPILLKAQQYYRDFIGRSNGQQAKMKRDAEKRIKDIDELFVALAEAAKMQKEAEEMQRKAEEQQKKMELELQKMQEAERKAGTAPPPAGGEGAAPTTPPPAGAAPTTPPPPSSSAPAPGASKAGGPAAK